MPLTDLAVRNAHPKDKAYKISDGEGLHLLVATSGGKLWRFAYRFGGKQKLLAFGSYPLITLQEARARRTAAKLLLSKGIDPSVQKRIEHKEKTNTFAAVAAEWLAKFEREGLADVTLRKKRWLMEFAKPALGNRPIADISAKEILHVLQKVERRGTFETALRLRAAICSIFRYAIATDRVENDPTVALRAALTTPKTRHYAAITDAKGLGGLMRAIETFNGLVTTKDALLLMAYLFPRPGELRLSEWVEFDLEAATWTIPARAPPSKNSIDFTAFFVLPRFPYSEKWDTARYLFVFCEINSESIDWPLSGFLQWRAPAFEP